MNGASGSTMGAILGVLLGAVVGAGVTILANAKNAPSIGLYSPVTTTVPAAINSAPVLAHSHKVSTFIANNGARQQAMPSSDSEDVPLVSYHASPMAPRGSKQLPWTFAVVFGVLGTMSAFLLSLYKPRIGIAMVSMSAERDEELGLASKESPRASVVNPPPPATQGTLGGQDFIYSQKSGVEDSLFKGKVLGVDADAASMVFREKEGARSLAELDASLHVPERFERRVVTHIAKNYLLPPKGRSTPLILGVWGAKGSGKSFNVELTCKKAGVQVVALSAGELEDEWAGGVAARIRQRYKACADMIKNEGIPAVLVVSDLDAGLGRMKGTQMTVNTQTASGELMAMCDGVFPGDVRVPIIVTANDLSRVYAPLLRDGRMDKWYWEPDADERARMLHATLERDDGAALSMDEARALIHMFPEQSLDFFGAARARIVDGDVWRYVMAHGGFENLQRIIMDKYDYKKGVAQWDGEGPLTAPFEALKRACEDLAQEQQWVKDQSLAREYYKNWDTEEDVARMEREEAEAEERRKAEDLAAALAAEKVKAEMADVTDRLQAEMGAELKDELEQLAAEAAARELEPEEPEEPAKPWRVVDALEAYELMEQQGYVMLDVRSGRAFDMEAITGARSVPSFDTVGFGLERKEVPREEFPVEVAAAVAAAGGKALIVGANVEDTAAAAAAAFDAGCSGELLAELKGGYEAWLQVYTLKRKRRQYGNWGNRDRLLYDYWTASN